jgi:hypothetical protein
MIRPGRGAPACASPAEEPQGVPAVRDGVKTAVPAGLGEGLAHYERIPGVIFDVQHIDSAALKHLNYASPEDQRHADTIGRRPAGRANVRYATFPGFPTCGKVLPPAQTGYRRYDPRGWDLDSAAAEVRPEEP